MASSNHSSHSVWNLRRRISGAPGSRFAFLVSAYTLIIIASLWLAYQLRFDFAVPESIREDMLWVFIWVIPLKLLLIELFRQFDPVLSHYSTPDLFKSLFALLSSSLVMLAVFFTLGSDYAPPRGVILADFFLSFGGISAVRLFIRMYRQRADALQAGEEDSIRHVGIIGTEDAAASLVKELFQRPSLKRKPVAFFDDQPKQHGSRIHDLPILGPPEMLLDESVRSRFDEVIIAMPGAPAKKVREIISLLQQVRIKFTTIPSMHQLATGEVRVSQLRSVSVQDFLETEPIQISKEKLGACLKDRTVLVTGAGGSIGGELCRHVLLHSPGKVLLVEQSEVQLFQIEQELIRRGYEGSIVPLVGNILDEGRMRSLFENHRPEIALHCAAHKHAVMMEHQPGEAIKNNVFGTVQLARIAIEANVERFLFLSSDNALNPSDVMGACKRLAEISLQALQKRNGDSTRFVSARFGNALGSTGSYVETFSRQIAAGGPVRISHPEAVRQFVTIPETCTLLLESVVSGKEGDIFYLDTGQPISIYELAKQMIELSGLQPEIDLKIEFTGLRPGGKLVEVYRPDERQAEQTDHERILRMRIAPETIPDFDQIERFLGELKKSLYQSDTGQIKLRLRKMVPEYDPYLD